MAHMKTVEPAMRISIVTATPRAAARRRRSLPSSHASVSSKPDKRNRRSCSSIRSRSSVMWVKVVNGPAAFGRSLEASR